MFSDEVDIVSPMILEDAQRIIELNHKINLPQMRQLKQRIVSRCGLKSLSAAETKGYIQTRLKRAGAEGQDIFPSSVLQAIQQYTQGIPRLINLVCENCMIAGYAGQVRPITSNLVDEAAKDLQLVPEAKPQEVPSSVPTEPRKSSDKLESDPQLWKTFCEFMEFVNRNQSTGD